jgi:hypothetical protein
MLRPKRFKSSEKLIRKRGATARVQRKMEEPWVAER